MSWQGRQKDLFKFAFIVFTILFIVIFLAGCNQQKIKRSPMGVTPDNALNTWKLVKITEFQPKINSVHGNHKVVGIADVILPTGETIAVSMHEITVLKPEYQEDYQAWCIWGHELGHVFLLNWHFGKNTCPYMNTK